ncbi:MAG: hypothetical protein ACRCZI_06245, partial [Cetobacterium sp.]
MSEALAKNIIPVDINSALYAVVQGLRDIPSPFSYEEAITHLTAKGLTQRDMVRKKLTVLRQKKMLIRQPLTGRQNLFILDTGGENGEVAFIRLGKTVGTGVEYVRALSEGGTSLEAVPLRIAYVLAVAYCRSYEYNE